MKSLTRAVVRLRRCEVLMTNEESEVGGGGKQGGERPESSSPSITVSSKYKDVGENAPTLRLSPSSSCAY